MTTKLSALKYAHFIFPFLLIFSCKPESQTDDASSNQREFEDFIHRLETEFIYRSDKQQVIDCIRDSYASRADSITEPYVKVLYYETILNEFHDSHISLNTNTDRSYRLSSPIYLIERDNKYYIKHIFYSQLKSNPEPNVIDAVVELFNGRPFNQVIADFPSSCMDKTNASIREWIANKVIAGRRDQSRILTLRLQDGNPLQIDLDAIELKNDQATLYNRIENRIGYIRINNSLGNPNLVNEFDDVINLMMDTEALILDLRNTPDGGNTDVAEPMLGRFITEEQGYQICENKSQRYTRTVSPRMRAYNKPVFVLVGRWTGSMGEGMAIGLDGMKRATIVGTEMHRLAGGIKSIQFLNSNFAFRIPFEKMYHLNGQLRETFVPQEYVNQSDNSEDHHMKHVTRLINSE